MENYWAHKIIPYVAIEIGTSYIFNYTGDIQSFIVPTSGYYKLEAWGANGATSGGAGGIGGYSMGYNYFAKNTKLYIGVGGAGKVTAGGFNGGGNGSVVAVTGSAYKDGGGGGGATHIALVNGLLKDIGQIEFVTNKKGLIVAGGGGGGAYISGAYKGGSGGGTSSQAGTGRSVNPAAATQTTGYAFGQGQNGGTAVGSNWGESGRGGGGGGLYGGSASQTGENGIAGGAGGSGFIDNCISFTTDSGAVIAPTTEIITSSGGDSSGNGKAIITFVGKKPSTSIFDLHTDQLANGTPTNSGVIYIMPANTYAKDIVCAQTCDGWTGASMAYSATIEGWNGTSWVELAHSHQTCLNGYPCWGSKVTISLTYEQSLQYSQFRFTTNQHSEESARYWRIESYYTPAVQQFAPAATYNTSWYRGTFEIGNTKSANIKNVHTLQFDLPQKAYQLTITACGRNNYGGGIENKGPGNFGVGWQGHDGTARLYFELLLDNQVVATNGPWNTAESGYGKREEAFTITLNEVAAGTHTAILRARETGNASKVIFDGSSAYYYDTYSPMPWAGCDSLLQVKVIGK